MDWVKDYTARWPDDPPTAHELQDFTYDLLNRLDAASATGGDGQGLYNENYDYDSQGNLWKKGIPGSEAVYTYLDSSHKHAVTHLGGAPMYGYDPNGNMTQRNTGTVLDMSYDAENRLVQVNKNGALHMTNIYDGDGERVKTIIEGTQSDTVLTYLGNYKVILPSFLPSNKCNSPVPRRNPVVSAWQPPESFPAWHTSRSPLPPPG